MYQSARIVWFDTLKGIGEAETIRGGQKVFINSHYVKQPHESFSFKEGVMISCKTQKNDKNGLFGTRIKLVK